MKRLMWMYVVLMLIVGILSVSCGNETHVYHGITFITIPGGSFRMGDIQNYGKWDNERPVHDVTLSGFEMSIFEITQGQYESIIGSNPSKDYVFGVDYPVYYVSWDDAVKFCNRLRAYP